MAHEEDQSDLPTLVFEPANDALLQPNGRHEHRTVAVRRPLFTRVHFEQTYEPNDAPKTPKAQKLRDRVRCDQAKCGRFALRLVPVYAWLSTYDVKNWLLLDVVCGVTIGIINIPQSMGYALLSGVEPLYGLYSSFVPPLLYVLFGTSRNMCYGTLAVTSLLVGSVVMKTTAHLQQIGAVPSWVFDAAEQCDPLVDVPESGLTNDSLVANLTNNSVLLFEGVTPQEYVRDLQARIAICLCFITGMFQLLIGFLRLGFLTVYFADAMMAGFTCATMVYAFVSQLKYLFGIHFVRPTGPFNIVFTLIGLFRHISQTNVATLVTSLISCSVLLIFKFAINQRVMRKIKAPIPAELLVVISGTLASYYLDMKNQWKVENIGLVRRGLPQPQLPDFKLLPDLAGDGLVVALVNFGVSIALASVLARKHKLDIDENQEAISYGISNLVSSFFQAIPTGGAVAATCVEESMKGKTQIVGLIASVMMLFVLAFVTHLFSCLPVCILSSIIVVGLVGMVDRFQQVKHLWKVSRFDCAIWMASFFGTVFLDVDIGLMFAILASFFILVIRSQAGTLQMLGNIPNTEIYEPTKNFKAAVEVAEMKIFQIPSPINFANSGIIRKTLYAKSGTNPVKFRTTLSRERTLSVAVSASETTNNLEELIGPEKQPALRFIILDLALCAYIDFSGLRIVKQIITDYNNIGIAVLFSGCNTEVRRTLESSDFYAVCDQHRIFLSVHDAVLAAQRNLIIITDTETLKIDGKDTINDTDIGIALEEQNSDA